MGFNITQEGIEPNKGYLEALRNYPTPKCLKDMRAFSGFLNQSGFMSREKTREAMSLIRNRLQSTREWDWTDEDYVNYKTCKKMAVLECKEGVKLLMMEDSVRPNALVLVSDWSTLGTGYIVYQVLCTCIKPNQKVTKVNCCREKWRIINCGGSFNTPTEARFAPIEGELLGITKALHKSRFNIMGHSNIHLITDHKPLEKFLENEDVKEEENHCLMNLRRKCENYNFTISYNQGTTNTADPLSCAEHPEDELFDQKKLLEKKHPN